MNTANHIEPKCTTTAGNKRPRSDSAQENRQQQQHHMLSLVPRSSNVGTSEMEMNQQQQQQQELIETIDDATNTPTTVNSLHLSPQDNHLRPDNYEELEYHKMLLNVVKYYYKQYKNYQHVYSGIQFGCHYVLYTDDPQKVHSKYAIYVLYPPLATRNEQKLAKEREQREFDDGYRKNDNDHQGSGTPIPWNTIQTLVRMMADLHKTLILVHVEEIIHDKSKLETMVGSSVLPVTAVSASNNSTNTVYHLQQQLQKQGTTKIYYPVNETENSTIPNKDNVNGKYFTISELMIATDHAPFRQQQQQQQQQEQQKQQKK